VFWGVTTMGSIRTGSTYTDSDSGYTISATAQGCYQGTQLGGTGYQWSSNTRMAGPGYHSGYAFNQRIRSTRNGVPVVITVLLQRL
jgi:hypothetical protein